MELVGSISREVLAQGCDDAIGISRMGRKNSLLFVRNEEILRKFFLSGDGMTSGGSNVNWKSVLQSGAFQAYIFFEFCRTFTAGCQAVFPHFHARSCALLTLSGKCRRSIISHLNSLGQICENTAQISIRQLQLR